MTNRLTNKTAVITGGTTGIGFETAKQYLAQGAKVVITGRNQARLDKALAELGNNAFGVVADVGSLDALDHLAEQTKALVGSIDILVANAGMGVFAPIDGIDEAAYDQQFDINVKGVFFTVQKLLPLINQGGSIILVASAVNGKGVATGSIYFASKAAVRSFARTLASELAPKGIRVNSLSPGIVRTNFGDNSNVGADNFDPFIEMVSSQAPLQRAGTTIEIANAAVFLGSDESSYVTADDMTVDGGWALV